MILHKFGYQNFRGLTPSSIELSPKINLFYGDNGVGKTSLIEAVYFLSCCKSFRTTSLEHLMSYEESWFSLNAIASKKEYGLQHSINVRRTKKQNRVTIDESNINRSSQLSQMLPTLVVCSERQRLFLASPQVRRNFLDWGLFHVKPESIKLFTKFERVLKQRNAAIKNKASADLIKTWDIEFVEYGNKIAELRVWFIQKLSQILQSSFLMSLDNSEYSLDYDFGYGKYPNLSEAISSGYDQDCRYGYTRYGPHRSDFLVLKNGRNVKDDLSKGQTKLLIYFLVLSQAKLIFESKGVNPWMLLDDFVSDFSAETLELAYNSVKQSGCQVFMTSAIDFSNQLKNDPNVYLFHVEHGKAKKMI